MVELARGRGVDARLGDVQALPFHDASFDCVVAAWMLYHVGDVDLGLAEIARVLRPEAVLVAVTNGEEHLAEARAVGGVDTRGRSPFSRENAEPQLRRRFAAVERRDVDGTSPAGHAEVRRYVESLGDLRGRPATCRRSKDRPSSTRRVSIFVASSMIRPADVIERKRRPARKAFARRDQSRARLQARRHPGLPVAAFYGGLVPYSAAETLAMTEAIIESGETIDSQARWAGRWRTSTRPAASGTRRRSRSRPSSRSRRAVRR